MAVPVSDVDLWSDANLADPYPAYRKLRQLGPVVRLDRHDVVAVTRFDEIRAVLTDAETYISGRGVGIEAETNRRSAGNGILTTDPPEHQPLRTMLHRQVGPRSVDRLIGRLETVADRLVGEVVERGRFDAVADLAGPYSVEIVADEVGLPAAERERLLDRAARAFDTMGPDNERQRAGVEGLRELFQYCRTTAGRPHLDPDGWGSEIHAAGDAGTLTPSQCLGLVMAYAWAGMDTTVNGIAAAVSLFGEHHDQWELLRSDPSLMHAAVNEVLRIEPPVQRFTRLVASDTDLSGVRLDAGTRVVLLFGSASRDERHFDDPDRFDITRRGTDHLTFGRGVHRCVGAPLAQAEIAAVVRTLLAAVERIDVEERVWRTNNALHGLERLVVTVEARTRASQLRTPG